MTSTATSSQPAGAVDPQGVLFRIGSQTKYIISTSGRLSSLQRYQNFLQNILKLDVAYLPIHSGDTSSPVCPIRYANALRGLPCLGGAISKDIKHSILSQLDEVDPLAAEVQSVNTVVVLPGQRLKGYNTDMLGFRMAIKDGIQQSGRTIRTAVCYGYGGVAFVVVRMLQSLGISVCIAGRSLEKAADRAKELDIPVWSSDLPSDLFVNATPASEAPLHQAPNFLDALASAVMVFDHEMPGQYLRAYCEERSADIHYIAGTNMYYPQMVAQWALFLEGVLSPEQLEKETLLSLLKQAETI
jgi:shikimate dehydrogenase